MLHRRAAHITPDLPKGLTPALLDLLRACDHLNTVSTARLVAHTHYPACTICTYFKRINECMGTHSRTEALLHAKQQGWLNYPDENSGYPFEKKGENVPV